MAKSRKNTPKPFIIDDSTNNDILHFPGMGKGLVPRNVLTDPPEMFSPPSEIKVIPRSDWSEIIKERKAKRIGLRYIRDVMNKGKPHISLDQNGQGFCWCYSTGHSIMYARGATGSPYKRLSPHAVACKIKNFRDEGGWCGLSAKFARENGYPTVATWPEKSMSRSNDKPEVWEEAKKFIITEDYVDLTRPVYNQNLTVDMVVMCLLNNWPCPVDFNWWSHSVCAIDVDEIEAGDFQLLIQNSWTDAWGDRGTGWLRGSKMVPDSALCTRVVKAAA